MADETNTAELPAHGSKRLPSVHLDSYNLETKDDEGFLGDRVSKGAFRKLIEGWRKTLRKSGEDPLGDGPPDALVDPTPGEARQELRGKLVISHRKCRTSFPERCPSREPTAVDELDVDE